MEVNGITVSRQPKLWLGLITSDKEFDNIAELTEGIWPYFDGLCAVVHKQGGDDSVSKILNDRKKQGFVVEREYLHHNSHSMNEWLFNERIKPLDMCVLRDSSERLNVDFAKNLRLIAADMLSNNIWNVAQRSKLLMFRRWFNQQFVNGLHWGLSGLYGPTIAIEKMYQFQDDKTCAYSVRGEQRPPTHRYDHEVKYLLEYGMNGNHLALFHQDPQELDAAYWSLFEMMGYLNELGDGMCSVEGLKKVLMSGGEISGKMKKWLNNERPFRNFYRFHVLGHTDEEIKTNENEWRIV